VGSSVSLLPSAKPVVDVAVVTELVPASTVKPPVGLASTVEVTAGAVACSVVDSIPGEETCAGMRGEPLEDKLPVAPSPVVEGVVMALTDVMAYVR
jgi:hypothetical protein